jgi:peroxin-13
MLESTFFATHSSFFAMVGVIDQFGQLRNALGSVLGLFGLVRWLQGLLTGRGGESQEMRSEFKDFIKGKPVTPSQKGTAPAPKPSKKPLIVFLIAIVAIPYLVSKLIRALNARQLTDSSSSTTALPAPPPAQIDPSKLQFARALYQFEASSPTELGLKENEIVAIMGKLDPSTGTEVDPRWTGESEWWRGRTRDGREGWFPRKWVEILEKREPKKID